MNNDTRIVIELPAKIATINRKVKAWKTLFGTNPGMAITGTFNNGDGELAFPFENPVIAIGRMYLTVIINGEANKIDPWGDTVLTSCAYLILR